MSTVSVKTHEDDRFEYFDTFEVDTKTGHQTFYTKSLKVKEIPWFEATWPIIAPGPELKRRFGWDIELLRWEAMVSIYNDHADKLIWDLHAMTPPGADVNNVVNLILANTDLPKPTVREYMVRLTRGDFTKQDGKDIVARLTAGESAKVIYSDDKYKKVDGIDSVVKMIYEANADKFLDSKSKNKMGAWLVGQVMKETKGKCDPAEVRLIVDQLLVE